ncbi:MAG: pallilysin-related adhesin [Treponema sp.]|nr:pallilysin-related adhesin [Treponema sp.]MCL2251998.1 pallilysin-related adhesin [Treponema sp.]
MKIKFIGFSIGIAVISILFIIFLATGFWKRFFIPEETEISRTQIITPREVNPFDLSNPSEGAAWGTRHNTFIPMDEGEIVIAILNKESEEGLTEEQFVVYQNSSQSFIHIAFLSFDANSRGYRRMWDLPTAATRPDTISLFSHDLIGDRNNCIIVTGMNAGYEQTMTIFRRAAGQINSAYNKIAELQIAGSIVIQEAARSLAYQQGIARGISYRIASFGSDPSSANILDQIETTYSFDPYSERYIQSTVTRIPGSQIEQRRLRELLSGVPGVFENFMHDLWYYVTPQGTIDNKQYIYFDPVGREIIFYGDDAQQVFRWQSSTRTWLGLFIRSQNISISTLLRFIDIELESLDSVKLRVNEDVRLKIMVSTTWDGSYRRAGTASTNRQASPIKNAVNALYDSAWGRIQFYDTGEYSINSGGNIRRGHYVFYNIENNELIELRPEASRETGSEIRMVYMIENAAGLKILSRVRIGTNGVHDLQEPPITLTPVSN